MSLVGKKQPTKKRLRDTSLLHHSIKKKKKKVKRKAVSLQPLCYFIGLDPGQSGGIARLIYQGSILVDTQAIPLKDKTERDIYEIIDEFAFVNDHNTHAVLEQVNSMPKQGVSSSFKFGRNYGMLEMVLVCTHIPYQLVRPAIWQGLLKCRSGGDKNVTKKAAQQLFPKVKITHAIADALLLAEYCRRTTL
jgi:hypothetical protein